MPQNSKTLLNFLNTKYAKLHSNYEKLFWDSYMGDHSVDSRKDKAMKARDGFRADKNLAKQVDEYLKKVKGKDRENLLSWKKFFSLYQTPDNVLPIKNQIAELESKIMRYRSNRKEGYVDPKTKKFVPTSEIKMKTIVRTNPDEIVRKACFASLEKLAIENLDEYIKYAGLLNEYAQGCGFSDFYDYKIQTEEGMTKKELFAIFDSLYKKTKNTFSKIRTLEKKTPNLRKPWNFGFMMSGDFAKEEDPYFQFSEALMLWGKSFSALGIDYKGGTLILDLLDRKGKWNNGFCHWPELVEYKNGKRIAGTSGFTCTVIPNQVSSGVNGMNTLFHEGGHAAHLLNSTEDQVCLNHEYAPASTAWAETQSMFLDTVFSSIEWKTRYAKNEMGEAYPFELFERKIKKLSVLFPMMLMSIMFVSEFEKEIYEAKNLTREFVLSTAKKMYQKYFDRSLDSVSVLSIPHLYSFESACSYHAYGLAELALSQWREYFYKKYSYIVDNPKVGMEMTRVWKLAAKHTFKEFVILATGKKLSPKAFIKGTTRSPKSIILSAKKKIEILEKVKIKNTPIDLNAKIILKHGKKTIATNQKSFEDMAKKYKVWLNSQKG